MDEPNPKSSIAKACELAIELFQQCVKVLKITLRRLNKKFRIHHLYRLEHYYAYRKLLHIFFSMSHLMVPCRYVYFFL